VDLLVPVQAALGCRQVLMGGGDDEGLEAEVGCGHGDEEERSEEHGARGGEAAVQLPVRALDLDLAEGGGEWVVLQCPHIFNTVMPCS
jgi:hypothetical protein